MIGKKVKDLRNNKIGYIEYHVFGKWYAFKYDKGGYLIKLSEIEEINNNQLKLF